MPPPHLHPRSRMTSSLFATTVFASFFVVVLPHILPCPAPRGALADGSMAAPDGTGLSQQRRRRRRRPQDEVMEGPAPVPVAVDDAQVDYDADGIARFAMVRTDEQSAAAPSTAEAMSSAASTTETSDEDMCAQSSSSARGSARECPVPKPGGIMGELLRFQSSADGRAQASQPLPPHPPSFEK